MREDRAACAVEVFAYPGMQGTYCAADVAGEASLALEPVHTLDGEA